MDPVDTRWMNLALSLGRRGLGKTWPNPSVGCVIVKNGTLVGRGWTQPGGRPHGEVMALKQAGSKARGSTVYVTLEPCAHHGKSPPCAEALVSAGVKRVVTATTDPDQRVSGKGHAVLEKAGIDLTTDCLSTKAEEDHAGFFSRMRENRPFVTLKLATSLDGRIATARGESQWITGAESRRLVHLMRSQHDAVMIGSGTAKTDDPTLTVRDLGIARQPVRIICDTQLSTDPLGKLGQTARQTPVWICHQAQATTGTWKNTGAKLLACKTKEGHLDIEDVVSRLATEGLTRVFVEGGGKLAASLLRADLVDQLITFTAGMSLGASAIPAIAGLPDLPLRDYSRFKLLACRQSGQDVVTIRKR